MNRRNCLALFPALALGLMLPEAQATELPFMLRSILLPCWGRPTLPSLQEHLSKSFKTAISEFLVEFPDAQVIDNIRFEFEETDRKQWGMEQECMEARPDEILKNHRWDILPRAIDFTRHRARRQGVILDPLEIRYVKISFLFRSRFPAQPFRRHLSRSG